MSKTFGMTSGGVATQRFSGGKTAAARIVEHVQYPEISGIEAEQLELPPLNSMQ